MLVTEERANKQAEIKKVLNQELRDLEERFVPYLQLKQFLSTRSKGVQRLSLVAGFAAAGYYFITLTQPYGPPAQDLGRPWHNLFINLSNLAIEAGLSRAQNSPDEKNLRR